MLAPSISTNIYCIIGYTMERAPAEKVGALYVLYTRYPILNDALRKFYIRTAYP